MSRREMALAACVLLQALGGWGAPRFFAAVGVSGADDVLVAAEEATRSVREQFRAGDVPLKGVVFLERVKGVTNTQGQAIGDKVKSVAGVPTFGTGATGPYGLVWGESPDGVSSFAVLGIGGESAEVEGYALGGKPPYTYWFEDAFGKERIDLYKKLWKMRGRELAAQVADTNRPAAVLLLGTLHNWWHGQVAGALQLALGERMQVLTGAGQWNDYVYCNGVPLKDIFNANTDTQMGQMAVVIRGDFDLVLSGVRRANTEDAATVNAETEATLTRAASTLRENEKPALVVGFTCGMYRGEKSAIAVQDEYRAIRARFGAVPVFGCYAGGEGGLDNNGKMSASGGMLALAMFRAHSAGD